VRKKALVAAAVLGVSYDWNGTPEGGDPVDVEIDSTGSTYLVEPD